MREVYGRLRDEDAGSAIVIAAGTSSTSSIVFNVLVLPLDRLGGS